MTCEECKEMRRGAEPVPLAAHEASVAGLLRIIKWLVAVIALLVCLLVGTNLGWLYYESQFEDVVTTYEANTEDGGTAIANGEGSVVYNGDGASYNPDPKT